MIRRNVLPPSSGVNSMPSKTVASNCLFELLHPEDEGSKFARNVDKLKDYKASQTPWQ
jgi:hypothetical protein